MLLQNTFAEVQVINAEKVPRPAHGRQLERWRPAKMGAGVSYFHSELVLYFLLMVLPTHQLTLD